MDYKVYGLVVNRFLVHIFIPLSSRTNFFSSGGAPPRPPESSIDGTSVSGTTSKRLSSIKILKLWNPFSINLSFWGTELKREMDLKEYYFFSNYWKRL